MTRFFGLLFALTFAAASCSSTEERSSEPTIEVLTEIYTTRPANIAVTPQGRVILTNHPLDQPELRAIEVLSDGSTRPFPTLDWSDGPEIGAVGLAGGIGITADTKGNVWFLDMGSEESAPQIVAWNTLTEELHRLIEIPSDVTVPTSFLQDFALDEKREKIYIADMTFPRAGRPGTARFCRSRFEERRVLARPRESGATDAFGTRRRDRWIARWPPSRRANALAPRA